MRPMEQVCAGMLLLTKLQKVFFSHAQMQKLLVLDKVINRQSYNTIQSHLKHI